MTKTGNYILDLAHNTSEMTPLNTTTAAQSFRVTFGLPFSRVAFNGDGSKVAVINQNLNHISVRDSTTLTEQFAVDESSGGNTATGVFADMEAVTY